jgi:hypothetical protein
MVRFRRGEELTMKRRRRGTGSSGDHSEVLPAFPGGDDVRWCSAEVGEDGDAVRVLGRFL